MALIECRNVEKAFEYRGGQTFALRQITFDIEPGELVTIMGPSGAGKSTLLNILGMFDGLFGGEYVFRDHAVRGLKLKQRQALGREHVGFVFQQFHLLDDLTVEENLDIPLSYRNVPRGERQAQVADMLDRFQIVAKKDLYPSQLSGGQQQQVAVARALIANPSVIFADEPTGSLHSSQAIEIMELLSEVNAAGTTIVQVTHDDKVAAYGRRIIELRDGMLVADSPT
ncbi:MAG: ABC transporter ATP-binding protein [Gemmatimonadota bacterium]